MSEELTDLDAVGQAELVRSGEVKSLELVDAAIARLEAINPELNAVIHDRYQRARDETAAGLPEGPFTGVPIVVKDLDGFLAGEPYHAGSEHLKRAGYTATQDSWMFARMKAAGMVVLGRTNTPELGLVPTTEPLAYGPTRNPWDRTRTPGGSSGGSAAAVAARAVAIGHAGDGGGSIRIPAAHCGLVGLLPSRGRTTLGPHHAEAWGGFVRRHVVTRSVRDSAAVLDVVHGVAPGDPYSAPTPRRPFLDEVGADPGRLRIGVLRTAPDPRVDVHADCLAAVDEVAALLGGLGHDVFEQDRWLLDEEEQKQFAADFSLAYLAFVAADVDELGRLAGSPVTAETVEPTTWNVAEIGRAVTAVQLLEANAGLATATRTIARWWEAGNDLLLTPTTPTPAPRLGSYDPTPDEPLAGMVAAGATVTFTSVFNATGQPAISVPLVENADGLPIGVQLVARYGREDLLLAVAAQLEAARPWHDRRPMV